MCQSGRAGDKAKKGKSPAKSGRVGITGILTLFYSKFIKIYKKHTPRKVGHEQNYKVAHYI